jgi:hypothetical protein
MKTHPMDYNTQNSMPPQFKVQKAFPERSLCAYIDFVELTVLTCNRCILEKKKLFKASGFRKGQMGCNYV